MKKLIPSLCMLIISAILLGTSTFAWFAVNTTVVADSLTVSANIDTIYLIIGDADAGTYDKLTNANAKRVDAKVSGASIKPSDYDADAVEDIDSAATSANWFYKIADAPTASTSNSDPVALTDDNFSDYVLKNTFYITVADSGVNAKDLKVKAEYTTAATGKTIDPVTVLVVTAEAVVKITTDSLEPTGAIAASIKASEDPIQVDVYVYYYGGHDDVFTNNAANLNGTTIKLTFTAEVDN